MSEARALPAPMNPPLWAEAALLAERLADRAGVDGRDFLRRQARLAREAWAPAASQPLDELCRRLSLSAEERSLVVLAGLAEEHEGYAAVFAGLHPRGEPRPTVGLFAQLHWPGPNRQAALRLFNDTELLRQGIVCATGDAPWPLRNLVLVESAWPMLQGLDPRLGEETASLARPTDAADLRAIAALRAERPCAVLLGSGTEAADRAAQLARMAGSRPLHLTCDATLDLGRLQGVLLQALLGGGRPVLRFDSPVERRELADALDAHPGPLLLIGASARLTAHLARPILKLKAPPAPRTAIRDAWRQAGAGDAAGLLAAQFPAPLAVIDRASRDAAFMAADAPTATDLAEAIKARLGGGENRSARRVTPMARWSDLVLAPDKLRTLRTAADRLRLELRVLDDWGFSGPAQGQRGIRMLFAGLPGTGKTLAAEVIAGALGVDMLVVDLAGVMSKWIGETEKNLAALFEQAEATRAVLFFDEADALFGKRTEVSDAHDRYANIETAFLLTRLDRFDGVAVLATNLRQNLDKAFVRRFDAIVDFPEPGPAEREAIWRRHLPTAAPRSRDLDLARLADLFPMSGAMIRNAALAAAFAAASDAPGAEAAICQAHLIAAIRLEFDKAGRPHPT